MDGWDGVWSLEFGPRSRKDEFGHSVRFELFLELLSYCGGGKGRFSCG